MFTPPSTKYSPKNIHNKYPAWQIGKEIRMFHPKSLNTPFPGKYEYRTFIGEGPKYTFREVFDTDGLKPEKRHAKASKATPTPGPGTYECMEKPSAPSYTIGKRYKKLKSKINKVPGVGSYNLRKDSSLNVPSCKFDQEKRLNENMNKSALKNPGPGAYNLSTDTISTTGPGFSFSRTARSFSFSGNSLKKSSSFGPGPGQYEHQNYIGYEGAKLSFYKEKKDQFKPNNNPPVGKYIESIKYSPSTSSYTMPKAVRKMHPSLSSTNVLGPATYNPNPLLLSTHSRFPSWSISNEKRRIISDSQPQEDTATSPKVGPGTYDVRNGSFPQGASYTMNVRRYYSPKKETLPSPGPGHYKTSMYQRPNEPVYSIGKGNRDDGLNYVVKQNYPGPGKYTIKDSVSIQPFLIPPEHKPPSEVPLTPGPGSYKIPCRFNDINIITRERGFWDPKYKFV